ncbi:MAG: hypothetical protein ACO1NO_14120, partial [Burkholderiaceae bacterium]
SQAHIDAEWGIKSGGSIKADGAIKAGESLFALGEIRSGEGYGVYAGLNIRSEAWEANAQVRASTKPQRLLSGWWTEDCVA